MKHLLATFFLLSAAFIPVKRESFAAAPSNQELPARMDHPPNDPLTPQESVRRITVPPGFHVDLVASEPQLVNPIAMTFDERGRIWITESVEYPQNPADRDETKSSSSTASTTKGTPRRFRRSRKDSISRRAWPWATVACGC